MIVFEILFLILSLAFGVKIKFKISTEVAVFGATFGMVLLVYVLGLINLLSLSFYIIGLLSIVSVVYVLISLFKRKVKLTELFTFPVLLYILMMFVMWYFIKDSKFSSIDEYMFWGYNLKEMLANSCLWASFKVEGIHLTYPPFVGLFEYIFCKLNGGFSELVTYLALDTLMLTSLLPLFKNAKYKFKTFVKFVGTIAITYLALILFGYSIVNLSLDCTLGILFGVAMYLAFSLQSKEDFVTLAILLVSLTLLKTNGILLAGIVIMQIFLKEIFLKESFKNICKKVGILLLAIVITFGSWQIFCKLNGKAVDDRHDKNSLESIDIVEFVNALFLNEKASERSKNIVISFWDRLLNRKVIRKFSKYSTAWVFGIINGLFLFYLLISKNKRKRLANFLSMNIGFVLYSLTNLLLFMFVFQELQGEMLMGLERYTSTYSLAMVVNGIFMLFENLNLKNVIILVGITFLVTPTKVNGLMADPRKVIKSTISNAIIDSSNEILEATSENDKIFIIDQKHNEGTDFFKLRFLIFPRETNLLYEWNLGSENEGKLVYYKTLMTANEFFEMLKDYDYLYVINSDEDFIETYGDLFSEDAKQKLENVIFDSSERRYTSQKGVLFRIDKENEIIY